MEGFCEAKSPVKPVTPKKNPAQSPVPISGMKLQYKSDSRWLNNSICVIAAIPAHTSWIVLSILIGFFDTHSFILTLSGWGWGGGEFIIVGLLDGMMLVSTFLINWVEIYGTKSQLMIWLNWKNKEFT